jgi:hypothetical protein
MIKGTTNSLQECDDRVREGPTVTSWRNIRTRTSDADHPDALVSPGRHYYRAGPSTPAHADSSTNVTQQRYSCVESLQLPAIPRVLLRIICSLHARVQNWLSLILSAPHRVSPQGADESPKINLPGCSYNLPRPFAMHMLKLFARPALTQPGLTQSKVLMPTSYPSAGVKRCKF